MGDIQRLAEAYDHLNEPEKQVLSNVEDKAEFLLMVLSQMEDAHLLEVAKQALRQNVKKCCNSL